MRILRWFVMMAVLGAAAGCAHMARMSDFPKTSEGFDFDALAKRDYGEAGSFWTQQTQYEYFVVADSSDRAEVLDAMERAPTTKGYAIGYSNKSDGVLIGERGLRVNEWNSVTAVYCRPHAGSFQVYFKNAITQDITGGFSDNRAKAVADAFCSIIACGPADRSD